MTKLLLVAILALMLVNHSFAQGDLTLEESIRLALERNFDIRVEEANVEIAKNNNTWGEAGRLPSVTVGVTGGYNISNAIQVFSPFSPTGRTNSLNVNPNTQFNWVLFNGLSVFHNKERLNALQQQTEGNAQIVIANTIQAVILAYYRSKVELERLESLDKQLLLSKDRLNYSRIRKELGGAVSTDVLLDETNYLQDSSNYINQKLVYERSLKDLNFLLNEDDLSINFNLSTPLSVEQENFEYEDLVQKMNGNNVDLRTQYVSQAVIKHELDVARSSLYPSLNLNANYSYNRNRVDVSDLDEIFRTDQQTQEVFTERTLVNENYGVNLVLSFNLFDGYRVKRAIQNAIVREDIGNLRLDRLKKSLNRDLLVAYQDYQIRNQLLSIANRRVEVSKVNLDISEDKYKNGTINSFDYRTLQNNYLISQIDQQQAVFNLIDSKVTLLRLTGGLIQQYDQN